MIPSSVYFTVSWSLAFADKYTKRLWACIREWNEMRAFMYLWSASGEPDCVGMMNPKATMMTTSKATKQSEKNGNEICVNGKYTSILGRNDLLVRRKKFMQSSGRDLLDYVFLRAHKRVIQSLMSLSTSTQHKPSPEETFNSQIHLSADIPKNTTKL